MAPWSLGERTEGATEADVRAALDRGTIVRTHVLRPTWHYVRDVDARWLLGLSGPRVHALNKHVCKRFELDDRLLGRCSAWMARALEGGQHLTREELASALATHRVSASGTRLAYIVMYAELERVICNGAPRGKSLTYALFDERVPAAAELTHEEALAELTRRFFVSRGPATLKDFCTWASLTIASGRRGLDLAAEHLRSFEQGDRTYWESASARDGSPDAVHFLQGYDEYFVSYTDSRHLHAGPKARPSDRTPLLHMVIADGRLIGHWKRQLQRGQAKIDVELLGRLTRARREELEAAAARYERFVGVPVEIQYGSRGARTGRRKEG